MKFAVGDLIIYGETGVCRVESIEDLSFMGEVRKCYKLQPLYQSCCITTPADNNNVFMRPILSRQEAENLVESIPDIQPIDLPVAAPRVVSEHYDKIIKSHDCSKLISLTVAIYHKRKGLIEQKKKLSAIDERYMKKAQDLLFGELAAALEIDKASVSGYIEEVVNK